MFATRVFEVSDGGVGVDSVLIVTVPVGVPTPAFVTRAVRTSVCSLPDGAEGLDSVSVVVVDWTGTTVTVRLAAEPA